MKYLWRSLTPELSRPDLRRRIAADYQKPQADAAKRGRLERLVSHLCPEAGP